MFPVDYFHHGFLLDAHHRTIGHCACGTHPEGLSCKASLSEEIARVENRYRCFLSTLRYNAESHLSFPDIEHGVRDIPLGKNSLLLGESCDCSTSVYSGKEGLEVELAA